MAFKEHACQPSQASVSLWWTWVYIPHEPHKQLFSTKLTIIGIEVNPNSLTFTLPMQALEDLLNELHEFMALPKSKQGASWTLQQWQDGWTRVSMCMIHPALNNVYNKIMGKDQPLMNIWVNNAVHCNLRWAINHLHQSLRIRLLSSVTWKIKDADKVIFCDACMMGLAFWYPSHQQAWWLTNERKQLFIKSSFILTVRLWWRFSTHFIVNPISTLYCDIPLVHPSAKNLVCFTFQGSKMKLQTLSLIIISVGHCNWCQGSSSQFFNPHFLTCWGQPKNNSVACPLRTLRAMVAWAPCSGVCYCSTTGNWC